MTDLQLKVEGELTFRCLMPETKEPVRKILLLLHGWTGDENTMWIFARQALPETLIISPRGFVDADPSGYGWIAASQRFATPVEVYETAVRKLLIHLDRWLEKINFSALPIDLMGFSQGAAMAAVLISLYPERIEKTALLAGFLPSGLDNHLDEKSLTGKEIFIAHGTKDDIVPYAWAEAGARILSSAGAKIQFCPSETGHKLSLGCTKEMQAFFQPG